MCRASADLMEDLIKQCTELIQEARLLAANDVYEEIMAALTSCEEGERPAFEALLEPHRQNFDIMRARLAEGQPILDLELAERAKAQQTMQKDEASRAEGAAESCTLAASAVPAEKAACEAAVMAGPPEQDGDGDVGGEAMTVEGMEGWTLGAGNNRVYCQSFCLHAC